MIFFKILCRLFTLMHLKTFFKAIKDHLKLLQTEDFKSKINNLNFYKYCHILFYIFCETVNLK